MGGGECTENSLNSKLTNDVLSGFFCCKDADNRRTGRAFNGKDHLHKPPPPSKAPVLHHPAGLLNFVGLNARVRRQRNEMKRA